MSETGRGGADLRSLLTTVAAPGRLDRVLLRTSRRGPVVAVERTTAIAGVGLVGDRRSAGATRPTPDGRRHVTLIQAEHLPVIAALLGRGEVDAADLRRNLVVSGINLAALDRRRFRIGGVEFEGTGPCHPCSKMERTLGPGGYQAVRGHGGLCARVLVDGEVAVGDEVDLLAAGDGPLGTVS